MNAQFLYPTSRDYPFDEVTYKIIKALEAKEFKIPGIQIIFRSYGCEDKYSYVSKIKSEDFSLYFCRIQGKLDGLYNNVAAINNITIPKKVLEVYSDFSGPVYFEYTGNDWTKDKNEHPWRNESVFEKYTGAIEPNMNYCINNPLIKKYRPWLVSTKGNNLIDFIKEWANNEEPPKITNLVTEEVFKEFTNFLEKKLEEIIKK